MAAPLRDALAGAVWNISVGICNAADAALSAIVLGTQVCVALGYQHACSCKQKAMLKYSQY